MSFKDKNKSKSYRRAIRVRNKAFIADFLSKNPCVLCGFKDIRALDFDHINPKSKIRGIGEMLTGTPSIEALKTEISKCQILCSNCHRIKTIEHKDYCG